MPSSAVASRRMARLTRARSPEAAWLSSAGDVIRDPG